VQYGDAAVEDPRSGRYIVLGYKDTDTVGFNAKHCVVIKFCFNGTYFLLQ